MARSIISNKAYKLELRFEISERCVGEDLYCCVFHHPLKSTWVTPTSYPVDYVHIVSNGNFNTDIQTYIDDASQIILRLVKSGPCDKKIVLDEKICYHLPICDATESWDFVFSNSPIVPNKYLDGYRHLSGNTYVFESDLIENQQHFIKKFY